MKENIGNAIATARKKKKISQDELAKKINVTRQTISNWERNIILPDTIFLKDLASELDLDFIKLIELTTGENKIKKKKRIIIVIVIFAIIFLAISILTISILKKNEFSLYSISVIDKDISIDGGVLALSKNKIFLIIGDIEFLNEKLILDKDTIIKLYQKSNEEERLIVETSYKKNLSIKENYGYNEYFPSDLDLENIYMDLTINKKTITLKLRFEKIMSSEKLFFYETENIGNESSTSNAKNITLSEKLLLENGYSYNEDLEQYTKEKDNVKWVYIPSMNYLIMDINIQEGFVRGEYNFDYNTISIRIFDDISKEYKVSSVFIYDGRVIEHIGNSKDAKTYRDLMQSEYKKVYRK